MKSCDSLTREHSKPHTVAYKASNLQFPMSVHDALQTKREFVKVLNKLIYNSQVHWNKHWRQKKKILLATLCTGQSFMLAN